MKFVDVFVLYLFKTTQHKKGEFRSPTGNMNFEFMFIYLWEDNISKYPELEFFEIFWKNG